ncbi:MAG: tetratricopeptide repeat protein, partial [Lysobacterales bacterium]
MPVTSIDAAFRQRLAAASALAHDGRMPAALAAMRDLVGAAPESATARHMLALFLHQTGDSERALAELEVAAALAPDDAGIANLRADALLALERPGEAAAAARAALALEPDRSSAQISLGLALLASRQIHEAQDVLAHALQRRPELVTIRRALVRCRLLAGQPDPALADALYPALLDSMAGLADMLAEFVAAGALSQHAALLRARAERHPHDHQAALALAAALHQLNRPGEALIWCERTLALRPGDRTAMEIRAAALVDRGDVEAGLAIYRELLRSGDAGTAARHLVLMHYDPAQDNETLFAAHRDYAQRHLHAFGMPFA